MDSSRPDPLNSQSLQSRSLSVEQDIATVLIVDNSESDRVTYSRYLRSDSEKTYHLIEAATLEEGLKLWRSQQPDIMLIDLNLPDGDGLEFLEAINVERAGESTPVIMLTGLGNEKKAVRSMKLGAADYLVKGDITAKSLTTTVKQVLRETVLSRQLRRSQQQQILIAEIALRISKFLNLADICNAIVKEVRQFIGADRAAIYQFNPEDMSGKIVAEDIVSPWQPCLNVQVEDTCFLENLGGAYCEGRVFVANDIYIANLTDCHIKLLERFQVRANLVVPILLPNPDKRTLWGLLILHQCSAPRIWEESDIELLQQLAVQLSISIQQAIAYQLLQTELTERKRVENLLLEHQLELEERNNLLEETSADLECNVEELRVTTEDLIVQHRQLEYEQIRYQNLFNFAPDGYLVTDTFGRISEANQAILNLLAISHTAILGRLFASFIDSYHVELFYSQLNSLVSQNKLEATWEITITPCWGNPFPAETIVTKNISSESNGVQLLWVIRNISDRKRAEQELLQLNQSLEAKVTERTQSIQLQSQMLEQIHDAVISSTLDGTIQTWNIGAERLYEYKSNEAIGQNVSMLYLEEDLPIMESEVIRPLMAKGTHETELRNRTKSGTIIYIRLRLSIVCDAMGNPIRLIGCSNNISDRKQAELQLQKTTDRLALALKSGAIGCWELNLANYAISWDERAYELHGIPLGTDVTSDTWASSVHPDDLQSTQALVNRAIAGEAEFDTEYRVIHPDRNIHFIKGYGVIERDIDGNPLRMTGINFDISASKLAEKALKQQLTTIEAAIDGIAILQNNKYIYLNQSHLKIFGYDRPDELLNKSWTELYSSEEMTRFEQEIFPLLQRDRSWQGEAIAIRKDGSSFDEGLSLTITEDGLLICVCRDISDRKQAEISLQNSEDRFRRVFDSSVVGMLFADFQGHIIDANDRFLEMVGYTREDFQSGAIDWLAMTPPEYIAKDYACMETLIEHHQIDPWEKEYYRKDGSRIAIIIGAALLQGTNNETICVILDISDRKQAETQLKLANQELLRATKLKDEFLANMSHELRTPLNSILGLSESLQDEILGSLNANQLKAIATVESSGEHLLSLINDILDLSKMSSGMMILDIEPVSVQNLCDSSLTFVKQQAFQKSVQINSNVPPHINNINIDERRIKQVLINLLTNSVKFTPNGGTISLLVAVGSGDTWQGEAKIPERIKTMNSPIILFQVVDTGIGIASNDLRILFQPFIQVDSALNRQYEGTGLGLALVKQIVELHGGQVMAESEVGQGSCFTVALPYEISQSNAIASVPTSTTASSQNVNPDNAPLILLAEDNEANIQTFSSYLTAINYHVILARNGVEAVAQAKANLPDIILMDIQMPTMDGLEATRQIRLDPNLNSIPIIALTALAMEGDRERCLAAGMNGYISKPLKLKQLARQIAELLAVQ